MVKQQMDKIRYDKVKYNQKEIINSQQLEQELEHLLLSIQTYRVLNAQKVNFPTLITTTNFQQMYSTQYSYYPQNIFFFTQYPNFDTQYLNYYANLPTTYQNQEFINTPLIFTFANQFQQPICDEQQNLSDNKSEDNQSTLEKSHQKKNYKKFSIFKYPKKNAESNIINQIFSFLSLRGKSENILEKILNSCQEKIQNFYEVLKQLKKKNKKYINRCYIKDLAFFQSDHPGHKIIDEIRKKGSKNAITASEFKKALRILVSYYLKTKCISTVITSRKLDKDTMKEHLHRKREVHEYLTTQMEILRDGGKY